RKSLADNEGMYFVFNKADFYGFWMKNMKFPIDIIYINNKHIVTIFQNVQNPKNPTEQLTVYTPTQAADGVLEVKAGIAEKYHFQVGDSILINL
ncbi:MAG TPA: DUF192 domain-containing protein, partial [Patescibacteria group bacterium]|nr:DUF192 domain-containing protein [Patescibacteria group bacterium]